MKIFQLPALGRLYEVHMTLCQSHNILTVFEVMFPSQTVSVSFTEPHRKTVVTANSWSLKARCKYVCNVEDISFTGLLRQSVF